MHLKNTQEDSPMLLPVLAAFMFTSPPMQANEEEVGYICDLFRGDKAAQEQWKQESDPIVICRVAGYFARHNVLLATCPEQGRVASVVDHDILVGKNKSTLHIQLVCGDEPPAMWSVPIRGTHIPHGVDRFMQTCIVGKAASSEDALVQVGIEVWNDNQSQIIWSVPVHPKVESRTIEFLPKQDSETILSKLECYLEFLIDKDCKRTGLLNWSFIGEFPNFEDATVAMDGTVVLSWGIDQELRIPVCTIGEHMVGFPFQMAQQELALTQTQCEALNAEGVAIKARFEDCGCSTSPDLLSKRRLHSGEIAVRQLIRAR